MWSLNVIAHPLSNPDVTYLFLLLPSASVCLGANGPSADAAVDP
jgi:hypothetical protein